MAFSWTQLRPLTEAEFARIVQALEAGAQEYVMKPFDADIIRDKFEQAGLLEPAT